MTKPRLAVVTVLSVIAYLGLAIVGAGGAARFFSYPPLIAVTVVTIALGDRVAVQRGPYRLWRQGGSVQSLGDRRSWRARRPRRLSARLYGSDRFPHLRRRRRCAGSVFFFIRPAAFFGSRQSSCSGGASAAWLRSSPNTDWSPSGLYGVIRHPSYLGLVRSYAWLGVDVPLRSRRRHRRADRSSLCWLASGLRSDCSARPSGPNTTPIGPALGVSLPYIY